MAVAWLCPLSVQAADLTIHLAGLRNTNGYLRFSLYQSAETYLQAEGRLARQKVPAHTAPMTVVFAGLQPGQYAITVHHDEDGDGKINRNLVGIPREGYGFSNDVRPLLGPPSFASVAIQLGTEDKIITITLRY
jgi:uncharacterized protein (DUF2141 family)